MRLLLTVNVTPKFPAKITFYNVCTLAKQMFLIWKKG